MRPPFYISEKALKDVRCTQCGELGHNLCKFEDGSSFIVKWSEHKKHNPTRDTNDYIREDNEDKNMRLNVISEEAEEEQHRKRKLLKAVSKYPTHKRYCFVCGSTEHNGESCKKMEKRSLESMRERFQQHLRKSPDNYTGSAKKYRKISKSDISDVSSEDDYHPKQKKKTDNYHPYRRRYNTEK